MELRQVTVIVVAVAIAIAIVRLLHILQENQSFNYG